jgi:DNA-binding NarL/FixJ family response regulator
MDGDVPARPDLSRQEEVLRLLADGRARELAEELMIRERTAQLLITETYPRLSRGSDAGEPAGKHE